MFHLFIVQTYILSSCIAFSFLPVQNVKGKNTHLRQFNYKCVRLFVCLLCVLVCLFVCVDALLPTMLPGFM